LFGNGSGKGHAPSDMLGCGHGIIMHQYGASVSASGTRTSIATEAPVRLRHPKSRATPTPRVTPPWNPTLAHRTRKDGAPADVLGFDKIKVIGGGQECPPYTVIV
jgi:hypothetical protein